MDHGYHRVIINLFLHLYEIRAKLALVISLYKHAAEVIYFDLYETVRLVYQNA